MTIAPVAARRFGAACLLAGALAACGATPPANPARQAEIAACQTRADTVFQKQNRYLLSERGNLDSPQSGLDPISDKSMGAAFLAGRYGRDQQVTDCERASGDTPGAGSLPAAADTSAAAPTQ